MHATPSRTDTLVIGAGHAGLATSRLLTEQGRDHVVLDRGRVASRWVTERWDSLRLLTPSWMTRLPFWSYDGPDPDGYLTAGELVAMLDRYAASFDAPVQEDTTVVAVDPADVGYRVTTDRGTWLARSVVVATGHCDLPAVPPFARHLSPTVHQTTPSSYRNPQQVPPGGVLVVGASASGVQIADELRRDGREIVLAVGGHNRMPRRYRGMDILWWLDTLGLLDRSIDEVPDPRRARREPSLQVVGRPGGEDLDLRTLRDSGVLLTGRVDGVDGHRVRLADDLPATTGAAHDRLARVLASIDDHAARSGLDGEVLDPDPPDRFVPAAGPRAVDLRALGIGTVVWATGYRREYPWLNVPVLDADGEIRQRCGVTPAPGLYVVGQRFQTRRNSAFIDGVRHDAAAVASHVNALRPAGRRGTARLSGDRS
jgi:putative flavoprotein involved in K+ transport